MSIVPYVIRTDALKSYGYKFSVFEPMFITGEIGGTLNNPAKVNPEGGKIENNGSVSNLLPPASMIGLDVYKRQLLPSLPIYIHLTSRCRPE